MPGTILGTWDRAVLKTNSLTPDPLASGGIDRQAKNTPRCVYVRGDGDHKGGRGVRDGRCAASDRWVGEGGGRGEPTLEQRLDGGEDEPHQQLEKSALGCGVTGRGEGRIEDFDLVQEQEDTRWPERSTGGRHVRSGGSGDREHLRPLPRL